jgi:hypothetical protein
VVPVAEAEGEEVFQVVVGSSANPGLRDFAVVAEIVRDRQSHDQVSFDVNPRPGRSSPNWPAVAGCPAWWSPGPGSALGQAAAGQTSTAA